MSVSATAAPLQQSSSRYAAFVLGALVLVYSFNFMDRYVFIISMEAIKRDLDLSDTQLGLLTGFAFSTVYSLVGLLAAYWAGFGNRRSIIAGALAAWSALTMLCAATRSFGQLVLARMGLGLTESACSPPALALISDYFPPRLRGRAFGIYTIGLNLGLSMGFIIGGWVGEHHGWRAAFLAGGLPGLLLAILVRLTVREPARGATDLATVDATPYRFSQAALYMLSRPSFTAFMLGSSLYDFAGTPIDSWAPTFLIRIHGLDSETVGLYTGVLGAVAGTVGSVAAGWLADRVCLRDVRHSLWVATGGIALVVPLTLLFLFSSVQAAWPLYAAAELFNCFYMAPTLAVIHVVMPVRLRALASALLLLGYNIIGSAGCSFMIGSLSDRWQPALHVDSLRYAIAATQVAAILGLACMVYGFVRLPRDFREHFGPGAQQHGC